MVHFTKIASVLLHFSEAAEDFGKNDANASRLET